MGYVRKIILINKPFQFRFSFYVSSWLLGVSCTYLLIISSIFDYLFRYLAMDPMGPELSHLEHVRQQLLWLLLGVQIILIVLIFIISIFMSHKIAGPLYRLRKYFQDAAAGNFDQKLTFRKKDYFQELASDYNAMMIGIRRKIGKDKRGIDIAISRIEKILDHIPPPIKPDLEGALLALKQIGKD